MDTKRVDSRLKSTPSSRRQFLKTTGLTAAAAVALPTHLLSATPIGTPIPDVKIGAISYSFRELNPSAEEILSYLVQLGLNTVELMGQVAEEYAGFPSRPTRGQFEGAEPAEIQQAFESYRVEVRERRLARPIDKFRELRRLYADAGVTVDILKLGQPNWTDAEIDYAYDAARAIGARGISFEASDDAARRMAPFATKHELFNGMHNHTQVGDPGWSFDRLLSHSPFNSLNLDIGHYVAGTGKSPIPIIQKYHDRITHLHLKDRQTSANGAENVVWGEGDTPIADVLRLIQREGYPITAMIELEYPVPKSSDVLTEVAKCVGFCRGALSF